MLNKGISVTKYFISAAVWVHWAMYWDFNKNSHFTIRSDSLRHPCYNRSRCCGRGNHPHGEVLYCQLRPIKQDSRMVERVFYVSMHIKKIMGTLPTTCEGDQPAEHYVSSSSWQAGGVSRDNTICWLEPALAFDEMTNRSFVGFFFVTLKHHQHHSPTHSTLCKNIHYLNALV